MVRSFSKTTFVFLNWNDETERYNGRIIEDIEMIFIRYWHGQSYGSSTNLSSYQRKLSNMFRRSEWQQCARDHDFSF